MKKTYRIMLFVAVISLSAILLLFSFREYIDTSSLRMMIDLFYFGYPLVMAIRVLTSNIILFHKILLLILLFGFSPRCFLSFTDYFKLFTLTDDLYIIFTCFSFSVTQITVEFVLDRYSNIYDRNITNTQSQIHCSACGCVFSETQAFCPKCYTISPHVKSIFERHPKKHYLDFSLDVFQDYFHCPYCGKNYGQSIVSPSVMDSPISCCISCNEFFTDGRCLEWSVISKFNRFKVFLYSGFFKFGLLLLIFNFAIDCFSGTNQLFSFGLILFALIFRFIWMHFIVSDDIQASQMRLKSNSDYPQILADMGYQHLDKRYHHLYKRTR